MIIGRVDLHYPFGKPASEDVLWRCEAKRYSYVIDPDREEYGVTNPRLELTWYPVQRRTPKGAWIHGKFIRLTAKKRWAAGTEEEAILDFQARRRVQVSFIKKRLRVAEQELALVEKHLSEQPVSSDG